MQNKAQRKTVSILLVAVVIMFGFSFALVPLYRVACKKIGLNTSVPISSSPDAPVAAADGGVQLSRQLNVQFLSLTNRELAWDFYPRTKVVNIHPGAKVKVEYYVKNNTNQDMTVQAVPSMSPAESISHFHKIECFCFKQQSLKAGEEKNMALIFQVDKDLPKDVHTITLAYTLFDVTQQAKKRS